MDTAPTIPESGDSLVRAAVHAFFDRDDEFFLACERRWERKFAPNGPSLLEVIARAVNHPDKGRRVKSERRQQRSR